MYYPNCWVLTLTCGRMRCLRRSLSCFLEQDYEGEHTMLIFNNSDHIYELGDLQLPDNKHVVLVNNYLNSKTGLPYTSLGEIHNDVLNFVPRSAEVIVHGDDDDLYLPSHITEGIKGLERCGKLAYKPKWSWFIHAGGTELMENTMEPSIFIEANFLRAIGYNSGKNVSHHLKWVHALMTIEQICSDPEGVPTLFYTWGVDAIYKTSGAGETDTNFANYRKSSQDFGNQVIIPWPTGVYAHLLKIPENNALQLPNRNNSS